MDCTVSDPVRPFSGPAFHFVTSGASPKVHSSTGHKGGGGGGGREGRGGYNGSYNSYSSGR